MRTFYFTPAFMPQTVQGPVRFTNDSAAANFFSTTSGGAKIPAGFTYPFTGGNFLKNGYKINVRTIDASCDLKKSDFYFYEKTWQQDWHQLSGFMYKLDPTPIDKPITITHEISFSKATPAEMPPVVTIHSPTWETRWRDEKDEVPPYKIGDTIKLNASAVNFDGTPVPDQDFAWTIHIDPWWKTPAITLRGATSSFTIPDVTNEEDRKTSKDRTLLAVITLKVKGKNGTESAEPFAMLVGRPQH
jgi:hypothetical protein